MNSRSRRGVLLLIVLALLAMFAMVAVAFVIMTRTDRLSAERVRTIDTLVDAPDKTLQQAFNITVRGSYVNPSTLAPNGSAITWQSLLEKIYGYETIGSLSSPATMSNVSQVCNGQLLEFSLPTSPVPDTTTLSTTSIDPFQWVGCVVTMLNGPAAGLSSRIVGINPTSYNVQMLAFDGGVQPQAGNNYIVNGFPYSGMGFGFNTGSGSLNSTGSTLNALLPNAPPASWGAPANSAIIPGGVNSDYTAADYTDPLVALAVPNPNVTGGIFVPIPSLHRSDLIQYSGGTSNVNTLRQVMFRPNSSDHPLFTGSNPNFNPTWDGNITNNPNGYSWDVDNDGDGIPDSVWVDLGLPVRFTTEGKAYKPLFAILCLDMDGRLNLNAHGNYAQTQQAYYSATNLQPYSSPLPANTQWATLDVGIGGSSTIATLSSGAAYFAATVGTSVTTSPMALPRGQGSGPAEVNLLPLFRVLGASSPSFYCWNGNDNYYQMLLSGGTNTNAPAGRYGANGTAVPGSTGTGSVLTLNNAFPYVGVMGGNYWTNFQTTYDAFGSPPDPQAMGAVALDRSGRPLYISLGGQVANGPYDFDFTRNTTHAADQPVVNDAFGVAEMERILRGFDRDATELPTRLANLTTLSNSTTGSFLLGRRAEFTTESSWVPVASAVLPPALRANLSNKRSVHPVDLLAAAIALNGGSPANLKALRTQLLPWEVLEGLKMDLNRPFGAGAFSMTANYMGSVNGGSPIIPDQPGTAGEHVPQITKTGGGPVAATFNYSADAGAVSAMVNPPVPPATTPQSVPVTDSLAARQLYARHLYILMMALADTSAILADLQKTNSAATSDDVARTVAQWAVNVVAYRDHNGIMIPFPYDPNPFGNSSKNPGWSPDNTPLHTVWGCKRPELLITETLAFHDVRTQDLNNEVYDKTKLPADVAALGVTTYSRTAAGLSTDPQTSGSKDCSFNSGYRPQGSLFVELYNPWTVKEPRTLDLSGTDSNTGIAGVQLNKLTPVVSNQQSPVWRLVIVDPTAPANAAVMAATAAIGDELPDPDNPNVTTTTNYRPAIERVAYFVNITAQGIFYPPTDDRGNTVVSYYPSTVAASPPIVVAPSGYAVVGSGDSNQANRTFIGLESGKTTGNNLTTRMVTLNPADLSTAKGVVQNTGDTSPTGGRPVPQVVGIDQAIPNGNGGATQRLSVSEPTKGYVPYEVDAAGKQATCDPTTGLYNGGKTSLDIPVDQQRFIIGNETFNGVSIWNWLLNKGTIPAFRIIYLQRLADPTRPFASDVPGSASYNANPQAWNPYRTIDAMTVDLTTFNGMAPATPVDPLIATMPALPGGNPTYNFEAHQRGDKNFLPNTPPTTAGTPSEVNLWKQEPALKGLPSPVATWSPAGWIGGGTAPTGTMNFSQTLSQTLGFLNKPFTPPSGATSTPAGDPQYPFPWLTFAGRPFNNEYELLLVPTVSSSKLLARNTTDPRHYFSYVDAATRAAINGGNYQDVYDPPSSAQASNQVPYPHLMNFFESTQSSKTGAGFGSQVYRIFAYAGVPSRFANAQLQMRADLAATTTGGTHYFHTPFNRISRYREPGRINLNTLTSADVLFGALNMFPQLMQNAQLSPGFWDKFVRSRRGDGINAASSPAQSLTNMLTINNKVPSRFMRPFRTPGGAYLTAPAEPTRETDVSLMRGDPDPNLNLRPLFEVDDSLTNITAPSTTPDAFPMASVDYNRNPYFRYQALQKLGNVVSTHSNVFAIWITVGYFEVMPAQGGSSPACPDGYQLGQELGSDSGDTVRHRAFYIFDRSIPVGFVRGKDINQDKAVLLRRFIE